MQNVVKYLCEVWHGNDDMFGITATKNKCSFDCCKLWARCLTITGTKFVPLCEGISGEIGKLEVDDLFRYESVNLYIDILVVDLTHIGKKDDKFGESEFM